MADQLQYNIEDRHSHTYLRVRGTYDLDSFLELVKYIYTVGTQSTSSRVICDIREVKDMNPSDTDRFRIGTALAEAIGNKVSVAGVAAPEAINHFAELVANNRGANFKIFSSMDTARNWILEDDLLADQKKSVS